jgi:polysaccharide export outer membrane protein
MLISLNLDLLPGDTVFVKENQEHTFYLMGEVNKPGIFSLGENMNLVRAMGLGQGYTDDANLESVTIIRDYQGESPQREEVNIRELMAGNKIDNDLIVNAGDLIYVPQRGIAKVNYFLTQLSPALSWFILSDVISN